MCGMRKEYIQQINPLDKRNVMKFAALERKLLSKYPLAVSVGVTFFL
jgi:hypothetical protein